MRSWVRRERLVQMGAIVALCAGMTWAVWPLPAGTEPDADLVVPEKDQQPAQTRASIDVAAFRAPIWNPAPGPAPVASPPEPQARPAPAPKLQLVGIASEPDLGGGTVLRAALYDPETGRLHLATTGESVGAFTIASVAENSVALDSGGRTWLLTLRSDAASEGG